MDTLYRTAAVILTVLLISFQAYPDEAVEAPTGLAVGADDRIYLVTGNEIQIYGPDRKFQRKLELRKLMIRIGDARIAVDNEDRLFLASDDKLYSFEPGGKLLRPPIVGDKPCRFMGLDIDSSGNILVANSEADRVEIYSADGNLKTSFSTRRIRVVEGDKVVERGAGDPRDVFIKDDRVYVTQRDGVTVWNYNPKSNKTQFMDFVEHGYDCTSCVVDSTGRLYIAAGNGDYRDNEATVNVYQRALDDGWQLVASYNGEPYRLFKNPQELAVNSRDDILIADTGNDRILIENASSFSRPRDHYTTWDKISAAELPKIDNITQTSARISWRTNEETRSGVMFNPIVKSGVSKSQYMATKKGRMHSVTIDRLDPGTRYRLILAPFGRNIPRFKGSRYYYFITEPPEGKTAYIKLPVLVVIFRNIIIASEETVEEDIPRIETPLAEIERISRELERAELFYWVNSGLRVALHLETLVVDDFYFQPPLGDYFYPSREGYENLLNVLRSKRVYPGKYGGVVVLNCVRSYSPETNELVQESSTSGGTIGGKPPIQGLSCWLGFSDNTWMFVHEFSKSVDIKFRRSGMPEYPDTDLLIEGNGGWGYEMISSRMRSWSDRWLRLGFGEIVLTDDQDNDGVADDDPSVSVDEKRFNTDPTKSDSDDDGVSDYDKLMGSNWKWSEEEIRPAD